MHDLSAALEQTIRIYDAHVIYCPLDLGACHYPIGLTYNRSIASSFAWFCTISIRSLAVGVSISVAAVACIVTAILLEHRMLSLL